MSISLISLYHKYPDIFRFRGDYKSVNEESIILVGTPLHRNLGDHLIAEGEKLFLRDTFPGAKIFEVPSEVFLRNFIFLRKHTPAEAKVFITGGGWMGDLWPKDELTMQKMLGTFSHCDVTILPQTIYYDNTSSRILLEGSKKAMANCKNLRLCTREEASYEFAKKNLGVERLILAPDMGLYYKTDICGGQAAAGICLRNDREKVESENVEILKQQLAFEYNLREIDTIALEDVGLPERARKIEEALLDFSECPVILTDRLQAMIFSVLIGTKCIALSNKTGKVAGIYNKWLKWDENIILADADLDYANIEMFVCTPYKTTGYVERLKPEFDKLRNFIKN